MSKFRIVYGYHCSQAMIFFYMKNVERSHSEYQLEIKKDYLQVFKKERKKHNFFEVVKLAFKPSSTLGYCI